MGKKQILLKDRVLGCFLGGAVGDALGAPFEGLWSRSIPPKSALMENYFEFEGFPSGQYTDDTQLTVATVEAILDCGFINPATIANNIFQLFKNQAVIGPGGACSLAASQYFRHKDWKRSGAEIGSAGNGTAMRTAILGFCFTDQFSKLAPVVADVSRITHHDPRSIAGGIAIAQACQLLISDPQIPREHFYSSIAKTIENTDQEFSQYITRLQDYNERNDEMLSFISWAGMHYPEFDEPIITPFVVPTVLASLWSIMKYPDSWADAVSTAIGFGGDVDTLGAIAGGLMGAKLGISSIPRHLVEQLTDREKLIGIGEKYYHLLIGDFGKEPLIREYER